MPAGRVPGVSQPVQREMGKEMWLRGKRVGLHLVLCNLHSEAFPSFPSNRKPPVTVLWRRGWAHRVCECEVHFHPLRTLGLLTAFACLLQVPGTAQQERVLSGAEASSPGRGWKKCGAVSPHRIPEAVDWFCHPAGRGCWLVPVSSLPWESWSAGPSKQAGPGGRSLILWA